MSSTSREQVLANRLNKRLSDQLARIRAELVNETRSLPESSPPPEKGHRLDILA